MTIKFDEVLNLVFVDNSWMSHHLRAQESTCVSTQVSAYVYFVYHVLLLHIRTSS